MDNGAVPHWQILPFSLNPVRFNEWTGQVWIMENEAGEEVCYLLRPKLFRGRVNSYTQS